MGVCKEERKLPIVQMGLFMDDEGIPIAIETFPGNTLDHLTLRKSLENNIDSMDFSRFIHENIAVHYVPENGPTVMTAIPLSVKILNINPGL